ncbi:transposable element Tcb1 transposase [Trichonephila clavipes]|nr:transposable element Tcb1 transposase [Trichonephila clavipes]
MDGQTATRCRPLCKSWQGGHILHSLPKVKHGEENANFQKPIRIEEDAIRCRGRWKKRMEDSERWRAVGRIEAEVDHRCCPFLPRSSFCNFTFMETIPNHTDSCLKAHRWSLTQELQPPAEDRYIAIVGKRNRRATTRVTSMVTASIGKAISEATVCRRLHMNRLYARVPRVCVPLSVQSRGAPLKWCREYGNWTVSDWSNVMFTDQSRFALEPDDKLIRIWRKQETHNQPPKSPNITHSEAEALWCGQGFH